MLRHQAAGQALVPALGFAALLAALLLWVVGLGQTLTDKIRLHNAADAAAYSAAQWQARALNFQAYTNRAIVANEVAIAQFVSLRSWSQYVQQTLGNTAAVGRYVPPAAATLQALSRGWSAVNSGIQSTLPLLETGISRWNVDVLAVTQAIAHQQALIGSAELVTQVARYHDPRIEVAGGTRLLQLANATAWQNRLTARYRRGSGELARVSQLLMDSRDGFSAERRNNLLFSNPLLRLPKRGGTDLLAERGWRGMDSLSLHINYFFGSTEVPYGWGAAENRLQPVAVRGVHGGSWNDNYRATRNAERALVARSGYAGLPEVRDIVQPQRQQDLRLGYSVHLALPQQRLWTAAREVTPALQVPTGGLLQLGTTLPGDALHALASAEVFFQRPTPRADGRAEYPSLFNPYWQVHLVPVSARTRSLTAPSRGVTLDPYVVLP
jgi:hypothetical protein